MKATPNYIIKNEINNLNRNEFEPVDYGHLVGAWEWGRPFKEIGGQFGVAEETFRDSVNRYKEIYSPYHLQRPGAKKKISN